MLVTRQLEAKIIERITEALATASLSSQVRVSGAWQPTSSGLVKWIEESSAPAFVNVAVGNPECVTHTTSVVDFSANITLFVRTELDPDGDLISTVAEPLQALFDLWQGQTCQQDFTTLDLTGVLSVDDVGVSGGQSPAYDESRSLYSVSWPITLRGSYRHTTTTTT